MLLERDLRDASSRSSSQRARARRVMMAGDSLGEERVAGEPRELDMEIRADAVPFLARPAGPLHHRGERIEIGERGARAGEAHGGAFQRLTEFGQRRDLAEIDRRDDPAPPVPPHQLLAFEPQQGGAHRRAGEMEARLEPALAQPLARPELEPEDGAAQRGMDLRRGGLDTVVGYHPGILARPGAGAQGRAGAGAGPQRRPKAEAPYRVAPYGAGAAP